MGNNIRKHKIEDMSINGIRKIYCSICGGTGESVTTDCCGKVLTNLNEKLVSEGKIDFIGTKWVKVRSPI